MVPVHDVLAVRLHALGAGDVRFDDDVRGPVRAVVAHVVHHPVPGELVLGKHAGIHAHRVERALHAVVVRALRGAAPGEPLARNRRVRGSGLRVGVGRALEKPRVAVAQNGRCVLACPRPLLGTVFRPHELVVLELQGRRLSVAVVGEKDRVLVVWRDEHRREPRRTGARALLGGFHVHRKLDRGERTERDGRVKIRILPFGGTGEIEALPVFPRTAA